MSARDASARFAGNLWLSLLRALLGMACSVDAIAKSGLAFSSPGASAAGDFQPSPLGSASMVLELAAGLCVLVGFRARVAAAVLGLHLVLGAALDWAHGAASVPPGMLAVNVFFIAVVLAFGAGPASLDARR